MLEKGEKNHKKRKSPAATLRKKQKLTPQYTQSKRATIGRPFGNVFLLTTIGFMVARQEFLLTVAKPSFRYIRRSPIGRFEQ